MRRNPSVSAIRAHTQRRIGSLFIGGNFLHYYPRSEILCSFILREDPSRGNPFVFRKYERSEETRISEKNPLEPDRDCDCGRGRSEAQERLKCNGDDAQGAERRRVSLIAAGSRGARARAPVPRHRAPSSLFSSCAGDSRESSTKRNSSSCFPFATTPSKRAAFLLARTGARARVPATQKAQVFI